MSTINEKQDCLFWIYDRMRHKHKENPNYDYMIKFKKTITEILSELEAHEKTKPKYRLKTWPELLETPEIKSIGFIEGVIQIISKNGSIQTHRTQLGKEVGKEFVGNGLDFVGLIPELFVKIR